MTKSDIIARDAIERCLAAPGHVGMIVFPKHVYRAEWLSRRMVALRESGAVAQNHLIRFPNGSVLKLEVLADDYDLRKLQGVELSFVEGSFPSAMMRDYARARVRLKVDE